MLRSMFPLVFLLVLLPGGSDGDLLYPAVKEGGDITLSCVKVQNQCESIRWGFGKDSKITQLFKDGQRTLGDSSSVRLLQNCSLVLHRVTKELAGKSVICQQNGSTKEEFEMFVASLSQKKEGDRVTLICSVKPEQCAHEVKWLNDGEEVKDHPELQMSTSDKGCVVSVSFKDQSPPSQFYQTLKCQVKQKNFDQTVSLVPRPPQDKTPTSSPESSTNSGTSARPPPPPHSTSKPSENSTRLNITSTPNPQIEPYFLLTVAVPVVVCVAVLMLCLALILWRRHKGSEDTNKNTEKADDGVAYASVQFNKKNKNQTSPQSRDGEEDVTYSSVKVPNRLQDPKRKTGDPENDVTYVSVNFDNNKKKKKKRNTEDRSRVVEEDVTYSSVNVAAAARPDPSLLYSSVHKRS